MPDNLQDLQDAIRVANMPKELSKKTFSLDLGVERKAEKPSFYSYSDDTIGMKYDTLSTGELVKRYENYLPGSDNNERLAQNQSTGEKWANGLLKFGAKTLSSIVGGTAGVVNGVGAAINDGKFSSVYDNNFSNWLADLDTKMNYQLPNYYTKQEQEKGFLGQAGTANFWADKFLGGLSFTAGAIVSEGIWAWATGGASLASTGARLGTKLARAGRWSTEALGEASVLNGMSKFTNLLKKAPGALYNVENTAVKAGIIGGKAGELVNLARFTATSAGYESSVEALQYKREATENFYNNFERLNGRAPQSEDIAKFEKDVESSANAVFGVNMAIVGSSNLVTMGNIFNLKSPIKTGISDFIEKKAFGRGLTEVVDDAGKVTYKAIERTGKQKASGLLYDYIAKPMVTEGLFEEGGQGVTTKVANKWIEHTYDPKKSSDTLDMAGLVYDSMAEQYGTKEGWIENGLGMLIGVVGGSVNAIKGEKQKTAELEYKASVANTFDGNFLQANLLANKIKSFNQIKGFNEDAQIEAKKGNIVKSQLAQNDAVLSFINAKSTLGNSTADIVEEAKQAMDTVTPEQWKEAGITDIETHKEETLGELERIAKSYDKNKTYWKYMIGNKLVGENSLDMGALDEVAGENLSSNNLIIESLTWAAVRGENAGKYMNDIQSILSEQVGPEHARTLEVLTDLNKQDKKAQRTSRSLAKQHATLIEKRNALVKKIERLNAAPREIETNKGVKNRELANTNQALLATNEKIANVESQLNQIAESINATKAAEKNLDKLNFNESTAGISITGDDLINLDFKVKRFQESLDFVKQANQQRGQYIEELLDEHKQASDIFMLHQATMKMAATAKLENINTWVGTKLKSKKEMDADTKEWLSKVATEYKNRKLNTLAEQGELINAEDETITPPNEKTPPPSTKGSITPKSNQQKIDELEQERQSKLEEVNAQEQANKQANQPKDVVAPQPVTFGPTPSKTIKLSEKGKAYTATFENGVLTIVDKDGKTPSEATVRKIQKKYAEQLNYTEGQLASDRPDYAGNENNWADETLQKSNNAWEIASTALLVEGLDPTTLTVEEKRDLKEVELADRIGKITLETFKEHSDISNLTPQILKTYISADGEAADSIVSELNNVEDSSLEFTEQDVVDFIVKYPGGKKQFYQSFKDENKQALTNKANLILELKKRFTELTGLPATKMFLNIAAEKGNRQMDSDSVLDIMSDEELTKLYNEQEQSFYEQTTKQAAERDYEGKNIAIENEAQAKRDKINEEYDAKVAELQTQDKRNKIEIYKQRIKDLLKGDYYNIDYLGEDMDELLKSRPSKADIDRYRELKKQGSQTNEMKALQRKLKNWKLLDSAIGEDYTSIADLIDLINQHEDVTTTPKVKTEITTEDIESILDAKSEINDESLLQNFSGSVTAKAMKNGNISFSHLKLGTIADRLGGPITILGKPATKEDLNALQTFDKDIPVTISGVDFTLKASGKIEMNMSLFSSMQNALNMYMFNPNSTSWTYKSISEFTGEDVRKIKSDFDDSIRNEDIYNLSKDEEVDFILDESDSFNQELLDKFLAGEIDRETLTRQVKIAAVKNGRKVSVVKSQRDNTASEAFAALRLKAAENLINNLGTDLGISTKVTAVYLGTPESQINQNGKITQISISKEAAKDIVQATGFIQDEEITASREFPNGEINTSYVGKISRKNPGQKIPFVVVTKGVYNIAYPVSLVKTADSRLQEFKDLLSSQRTIQEKAIEINNLIKKYNLDPNLLVIVEDLQNQNTLNKLAEAFDKKENFISVDDFASSNYNKESVADDVTIDIDLDNLDRAISDPKVRVSFEKGDVIFRDDFKEMGVLPGEEQITVNPNDARNGQINSIKDCD